MGGMKEMPPLLTIEEVREIIGKDRVGQRALYKIFRAHGVRLGRRLLLPRAKLELLLAGLLDANPPDSEPGDG